MRSYLIYGAGGHARVVADAIRVGGGEVAAFIDDHAALETLDQAPVLDHLPTALAALPLIIGIGNNRVRRDLADKLTALPAAIVHPAAVIASDVVLGEGTVVLANAVIQTGTRIGRHVIVNANVCVDHDAVIEDYVHLYPGCYIGGGSIVKAGVTLGPGTVIPRNTLVEADR